MGKFSGGGDGIFDEIQQAAEECGMEAVLLRETDSDEEDEQESSSSGGSGWGQLHETILDSFLDGEEEWESPAVTALAKSLRVEVAELEEILETSDQQKFQIRRLEKLLERQNMSRLGYNWSNLEAAVLGKLSKMVASGAIRGAADLLAVAKAANGAVRRGSAIGVPQVSVSPIAEAYCPALHAAGYEL